MKSWTRPTNEMIERALSSVKKETDRQYFFSRLKNPLWISPLLERGYFSDPPKMRVLSDGYVQYPHWPELAYLVEVASEAAAQTIDIVLALPKTDNPRVYEDILSIALNLEKQNSARLLPKLIEYAELENQLFAHRYSNLLQNWVAQGNIKEALEMADKLIPFREDAKTKEKQQTRKEDPDALNILLEPTPRFNSWEYQQILEKGVRPLAENEPYQAACILIDAVANMIRMKMHTEDLNKRGDEDLSEIWCRRLDKSDLEHQDVKEALVHTLIYACERVYRNAPEFIDLLNQKLQGQRWKLFKRLRQLLYASYPNEQTLPWIRDLILAHSDYSKWEHHYEFQLMIRKACEHFGSRLLTESEQSNIFDAILCGPSKEKFREWMGERYSEDAFQQRQHHFHRRQLRPFLVLLKGRYKSYFDEIEENETTKEITDDEYSPYSGVRSGMVSYRSPKSIEDLESFADEVLLNYLNEWNDEHQDKNDWLVKINISSLADVFQSLFKERIVSNEERFAFWMSHRDDIARPIYVASIVKVMQELIKDENLSNLSQFIEFCEWVLSHPDTKSVDGQPKPQDSSRDFPSWASSRRAVVDFIDVCIDKDIVTPITARNGLAHLLRLVCNQFDYSLDCNQPVLLNQDDPITEAINNTRSRALESLISFGFWIRCHLPEDSLPEVTDILSTRISEDAEFRLTRPEHALLGIHFGRICATNKAWAIEKREILFPQRDIPVWWDALSSYLRFNPPHEVMFEVLQKDFEFAVENLNILVREENNDKESVSRLGFHLFAYYLWGIFPLTGEESLLARFYDKTRDDRECWTELFRSVSFPLKNSERYLNEKQMHCAIAYVEWRIEVAEPKELQGFTFWLDAECLSPEWRLRSFSKILDLKHVNADFYRDIQILSNLLLDNLQLVVECFAKIMDSMEQGTYVFIPVDEVKQILKIGLKSEVHEICENAKRAREKLLQLGRFDFLNLE